MKRSTYCFVLTVASIGCDAADVQREDWVAVVEAQLPVLMCINPPFSVCFEEDRQTCEGVARNKIPSCVERVGVPLDFPARRGEYWGRKVGECVGEETEEALTRKKPKPRGC